MSPKRLKYVSEFLFPEQNWREAVAAYLGVNTTTVWRWEHNNRVPRMAAGMLEFSFDYGLIKEGALKRE